MSVTLSDEQFDKLLADRYPKLAYAEPVRPEPAEICRAYIAGLLQSATQNFYETHPDLSALRNEVVGFLKGKL